MDEAAGLLEHHWPGAPGTLEAVAQFYRRLDPARARRAMQQLVEVRPAAAPCIGLAGFALAAGDRDRAMSWYDKGIAVEPQLAATWYCRGQLWEQLQEIERARADYRQAIAREPGYFVAALALAETHAKTGDTDAAIATLTAYLATVRGMPVPEQKVEAALRRYRGG